MTWDELTPHLTGMAHLATSTADGAPHVSVVSTAVHEGAVWFSTFKSSAKAKRLAANPRAAIMWQPQAEAYVQGSVELLDDLATKTWLWNSGLMPYDLGMFFQSPENDDMVVVKVTPTSASLFSMDSTGAGTTLRWRA